jgi:hypothetical protein
MRVVGIDYSMTCPAITIINGDTPFTFSNCQCFYRSSKLPNSTLPNVFGSRLIEFESNEQRFDDIASWAMDCIAVDAQTVVFIEGYSMSSKGLVFNIAENTAILKHKLWKAGVPIQAIPPTVIKKFAFGKGNATKDQMHDIFVKETGTNLLTIYQPKAGSVGSPTGDLVDSYYICKYGCYEGVIQRLNTAKG